MRTTSFRTWQFLTAACLFTGYSGYYLCRTNLAVAAPLLIREFADQGLDKTVMGQIASLGVICYAVGKVINGVLGDFIGGKKVFILGMLGAVLATFIFSWGTGLVIFFAAWALNRLLQSMGWGGLIKITANWFSYQSYGKIMSFLSLSFLFGDIAAKLVLGQLLNLGLGWRAIFWVAAGILAVIAAGEFFFLKNRPESCGFAPPAVNPHNLFAATESANQPQNLRELLLPYFKSFSFWLVLGMSFGLTAIRETLNFWMPTYLFETLHLSEGQSSQVSALYPVAGVVSILGAGYISDNYLKGNRGLLIFAATLALALVFIFMRVSFTGGIWPFLFIVLMGLLLLGPYSFLAGAMALDAGGRKGGATAAGLIDAVGYLGGTLAVWATGYLAEQMGWYTAFVVLASIAVLTALLALVFYLTQEKPTRYSENVL